MKIIMTMAGSGTRFREKGYSMEKYEILLLGKPIFEWAVHSLESFREFEFIFVARDKPAIQEFVREGCRKYGITRVRVKTIDSPTRGQAETALLAGEFIRQDDSIVIFNIDTHVVPGQLKPELIRGDGWIPVFYAPGTRWSFVEIVDDGRVVRTAEKIRISDNCSIGLYYFDSFKGYKELVMKRAPLFEGNEWYIAPLYNDLIDGGKKVYADVIPQDCVFVLGTPEDLSDSERRLVNRAGAN